MNVWTYLRDQIRLIVIFTLAILFVLTFVALDAYDSGYHIPANDVLYAGGLGAIMLLLYLGIEYLVRRQAYGELTARQAAVRLDDAGVLPVCGTMEQKAWARLIRRYHQAYVRELAVVDEKRQFYELFLTRFAHQMKTPLTVIQLLQEELKRAVDGTEQSAHTLALIDSLDEERERLDENLNLILQTARLTSFSFDARMEQVDLVALLRATVNQHKTAWIRRALYPRIVCDEQSLFVHSDHKWLHFICDQILRNALQYGGRPGTAGTTPFVIRVTQQPRQVSVAFMDEGIGIPERDIRHVFDLFFTGANGRAHSRATGMGLYLVKQVCDKLGHRITVSSKEQVGTTFTLIFERSAFYAPII